MVLQYLIMVDWVSDSGWSNTGLGWGLVQVVTGSPVVVNVEGIHCGPRSYQFGSVGK